MVKVVSHRSRSNILIEQQLTEKVETLIDKKWKSVWYRRLWFYFFEKEIRSDIQSEVQSQQNVLPSDFANADYQALLSRSALDTALKYHSRDELTLLVNDYIFAQGVFEGISLEKSDQLLIEQLCRAVQTMKWGTNALMSDVVFQLRRARADALIAQELLEGKHTYQSLLKRCSDYLGSFSCLPRFFETKNWSMETLIQCVDHPESREIYAQAHYKLEYAFLSYEDISPYGSVTILRSPYAHTFSRVGRRRAQQDRYIKILLSVLIVVISGYSGGPTLFILPLVWGLLASARSFSQYLRILSRHISKWYISYTQQYENYLRYYDTMVDPNQSSKETLSAEYILSRWFEVIPFATQGNGLWLVADQLPIIYQSLVQFTQTPTALSALAQFDALAQRSQDHRFNLMIVVDDHGREQILYRFLSMMKVVRSVYSNKQEYQEYYTDHYHSIDELMISKRNQFRSWTSKTSLKDGFIVGVSSWMLGYLASYLWNGHPAASAQAFAASPGTLILPDTDKYSDILLTRDELLDTLQHHMSQSDSLHFLNSVTQHPSATLRDTLVDQFGYQQGNVYTNNLMDTWWRISNDQMTSNLFDQAIAGGLPLSPTDSDWTQMINFLKKIYHYDNLAEYSVLIDQPWLTQTLQGIGNGQMSVSEFATLSLQQREIITQAMFRHLKTEQLSSIFTITADGATSNISGSVGSHYSGASSRSGSITIFYREKIRISITSLVHSVQSPSGGPSLSSSLGEKIVSGCHQAAERVNAKIDGLHSWKRSSIEPSRTLFSLRNHHLNPFVIPLLKKDKTYED